MKKLIRRFASDEQGLESVEYAVLGGLLVVAIVAAVAILGPAIQAGFQKIADDIPQ